LKPFAPPDFPRSLDTLNCRGVLAYCRAGFEKELALELMREARHHGVEGEIKATEGSAFVLLVFHTPYPAGPLLDAFTFDRFIFARQCLLWLAHVVFPDERDRISPIVRALDEAGLPRVASLMIESANTDQGAGASGFCTRFSDPLSRHLEKAGFLGKRREGLRLHVFVPSMEGAHLAIALPEAASPFPMGVMRLRMSRDAPSRSSLKLAEAFKVMFSEDELRQWLRPGARAVDLGAAPGGWSWQLAQRGLRVVAIDNANMSERVLATEMVEHIRTDGLNYRPKGMVDWLVCDIVEKPSRIALLVSDWVAHRRCRRALFNLKLPMKKRLQAVEEALSLLRARMPKGERIDLRAKHLYHDREEITVYLALDGKTDPHGNAA
jgi:23S rRNA (cytidine2498-2'-O)-methyltransferase